MHYLSPVEKSALLEIVKTPETMDRAIATAVAVGRRQGKTMIIVRDSAGAYVRRILTPYFNEAVAMVGEGIPVERIDQSLLVWGFAEGPLRHLDEIGIDFAAFVATALSRVHGARLAPSDALSTLARDHRCGRKNARGFYRYGAMESRRASKTVDATVYETLRAPQHALVMPEEPSLRCALAFINEAVRCLEDGVLCSARDGDVGAVYGCGFPGFRGGPFRYIDAVGANEIVRRTRALEQRFGARFTPAPRLVEMARSGKRFYEPFVHGDRTAEHGLPA
jgi:3-hydroxyacyl-CoA dehydrogenase/enoyl-CoA hydratase/3-hydroxybutyryl-CoA epimerase